MRDAENESHEGKRKTESLWPIMRISHARSRYIYDLYYKREAISRELYDWLLKEGYGDIKFVTPLVRNLIRQFISRPTVWSPSGRKRATRSCVACVVFKRRFVLAPCNFFGVTDFPLRIWTTRVQPAFVGFPKAKWIPEPLLNVPTAVSLSLYEFIVIIDKDSPGCRGCSSDSWKVCLLTYFASGSGHDSNALLSD